MECTIAKNKNICTCSYPGCPRKGRCCECIMYHKKNGELPGCLFSKAGERSYDRSVANFIRDQS
ncbi:hypothetical protein KY335_02110 [Candidatus Woesearchaeota archaeon]|nr:hypothetical protein [Candidatus Woesearchaeota archaeon]